MRSVAFGVRFGEGQAEGIAGVQVADVVRPR